MRIEVSDDFADMLLSFDKDIAPHAIMEALKWATEKPDEASRIVDGWRKLKRRGKSEFQWRLSIGSVDPAEALDYAAKYEARNHEQASGLRTVRSKAKKEGYTFSLSNGVQCTILYKEGEYRFVFTVVGEEIILCYSRITFDAIEEAEKYSQVLTRDLYTIVYKDKVYDTSSPSGKALMHAIEQNVNPKVAVVILPP